MSSLDDEFGMRPASRVESQLSDLRRAKSQAAMLAVVAAVFVVVAVALAVLGPEGRWWGAATWLVSSVCVPTSISLAVAARMRSRRKMLRVRGLVCVGLANAVFLLFGLVKAWDVTRRFW